MKCFDRHGQPISVAEWTGLIEGDRSGSYRRVCATDLPDGRWLSTVWLGLNHNWGEGPPLIFETMLFAGREKGGESLDCWRWSTEEEASEGHGRIVARLEAGLPASDERTDG